MPLEIEIVTPVKLAYKATVDSFTGPGAVGEFGILAGHQPLLAAIHAGVVTCVEKSKTRKLAIGPGFAEVERDRVIVLTESVLDPTAFESNEQKQEALAAAKKDRDDADAKLRAWNGPTDAKEFEEARRDYEWATARLDVIQSAA